MRPAGMTRVERESRSRLKPLISYEEFLHATPNLRQVSCVCFIKGKYPKKSSKNTHEAAGIFSECLCRMRACFMR